MPTCSGGARGLQVRAGAARAGALTHCMRWWGAARRAHDIATEYACTRQAFKKPLIEHEGVGFMLARNEIELEQTRLMIDTWPGRSTRAARARPNRAWQNMPAVRRCMRSPIAACRFSADWASRTRRRSARSCARSARSDLRRSRPSAPVVAGQPAAAQVAARAQLDLPVKPAAVRAADPGHGMISSFGPSSAPHRAPAGTCRG